MNGRALLNLGHTFGHARRPSMANDGGLLHGEGVAIGLGLAFRLCRETRAIVSGPDMDRVDIARGRAVRDWRPICAR